MDRNEEANSRFYRILLTIVSMGLKSTGGLENITFHTGSSCVSSKYIYIRSFGKNSWFAFSSRN